MNEKISEDDPLKLFASTIDEFDVQQRIFYIELLLSFDFDVHKCCSASDLQLKRSNSLSIIDSELCLFLLNVSRMKNERRIEEIEHLKQLYEFYWINTFFYIYFFFRWLDSSHKQISKKNAKQKEFTLWEKLKFKQILDLVDSQMKDVVQDLINSRNYTVDGLLDLLGLPKLPPNDVDIQSPENEACVEFQTILNKQLPCDQHEEAFAILKENSLVIISEFI